MTYNRHYRPRLQQQTKRYKIILIGQAVIYVYCLYWTNIDFIIDKIGHVRDTTVTKRILRLHQMSSGSSSAALFNLIKSAFWDFFL